MKAIIGNAIELILTLFKWKINRKTKKEKEAKEIIEDAEEAIHDGDTDSIIRLYRKSKRL